ncbi:MAG: cation diffusion facilitator family transporter [Acidimicrobiales bacterium]|jgi:cobalt-zinc-cadmium efflux system protein|nr:cation diffusion facilitator family transporter [Acidimicrobiales bacterium]
MSDRGGVSREARLRAALVLNLGIVVVQVVGGVAAHSLGLLADAGHNLTDVAAVVLSLVAVRWAKRAPNEAKSFGYHRSTVLAAQANAATIIAITAVIGYEAVHRLVHPHPVSGGLVVVVALVALVVNAVAMFLLSERGGDLNMRSARLHMMGDAAASAAVAIAGGVIAASGRFYWLDPFASLVIGLLIAVSAAKLIKQTTDVLLESTPQGLSLDELGTAIENVAGVEQVHDLHVWGLTDEMRVLSAHLVLEGHPTLEEAQAIGMSVKRAISWPFGIAHATLELECEGCVDDGSWCAMTADPFGKDPRHHIITDLRD